MYQQGFKFLFFGLPPIFSYFLGVLLGALKQLFEIKLSVKLINAAKKNKTKKTESPTVCEKDHFEDRFRFHDFLLKLVPRFFSVLLVLCKEFWDIHWQRRIALNTAKSLPQCPFKRIKLKGSFLFFSYFGVRIPMLFPIFWPLYLLCSYFLTVICHLTPCTRRHLFLYGGSQQTSVRS